MRYILNILTLICYVWRSEDKLYLPPCGFQGLNSKSPDLAASAFTDGVISLASKWGFEGWGMHILLNRLMVAASVLWGQGSGGGNKEKAHSNCPVLHSDRCGMQLLSMGEAEDSRCGSSPV